MTIRLLLADDHDLLRLGFQALLASHDDLEIVAEAANGEQAFEAVAACNPDLVVLDVRMAQGDGLNCLGRLKLEYPDLPVLMISSYDNPTYVARAVALGASGYLLKSSTGEELVEAIRTVAAGESVWKREALRRMTGALATPRLNVDVEVPLTQRESEVLQQMALGLTNKEIALVLGISYETVKEHVQHVLRKVGVVDRTQASVWAVRSGLV
ncbi:MAG: response regulator transcription factor [Planctomycetota bacterium]|nr:response regulator transcription factor [Planctomycetota bacterium]